MTIPKLQERINKIKLLLDDPHPGIFTWLLFLDEQMNALCAEWQGEKPNAGITRVSADFNNDPPNLRIVEVSDLRR